VTTFAAQLERDLRDSPARPLVTAYDAGARIELSVASYANWVDKTASLLVEELELERGDRLLLDLPMHWLGPVLMGAAWRAGLQLVWEGTAQAVVCGPGSLPTWEDRTADLVVLATALDPLGQRFADGVPTGVHDLGVEVWSQPDVFLAVDPPGDDDLALPGLTQSELWSAAAAGDLLEPGGRLLTGRNPASADGYAGFTQTFAHRGSLVLAHGTDAELATIASEERTTAHWA
jgi:uncharacterized protein (TIGR03089 family)